MSTESCPFCRIARGEEPARIVHRDDAVIAFHDRRPAAPTHILVIPAKHLASLEELRADDAGLLDQMIQVAREAAGREGAKTSGYRLVINTGENAGQTVFHLHMHLLAGRRMHWPPG